MPGIASYSAEEFSAHETTDIFSVHRFRALSEAHPWSPKKFQSRRIPEESTQSLPTGFSSPPSSDDDEAPSHSEGSSRGDSGRRDFSPLTPPSEPWEISPSLNAKEASFPAFVDFEDPYVSIEADIRLSQSPETIPFPFQSESPARANAEGAANHTPEPSRNRRFFTTGSLFQTPPAFADRFISNRGSDQSPTKSFRLSKSPKELSSIERLRRDASSTPDPFTSPSLAHNREGRLILFPSRNGHSSRPRVGGALGGPSDVLGTRNRNASTGAIWNVGGNAATVPSSPIEGIPNGRGGFLSSGSNAPMYTSSFFEDDKSNQDHEFLEGRLAVALDIDRTTRLLNISQTLERSRPEYSPAGRKRQVPKQDLRTKWINGEWAQEGSPSGRPILKYQVFSSSQTYIAAVSLYNRYNVVV